LRLHRLDAGVDRARGFLVTLEAHEREVGLREPRADSADADRSPEQVLAQRLAEHRDGSLGGAVLDAFKEEDIEVLSTLADQVAISIQNARLFEITQKLLEEAQRTSGFYLQDSWRTLKSQSKLLGYQVSGNILKPLDQFTDSVLIAKVSSTGETVVEHGEGTNLTVPIRLAGNIVGVVSIRSPEEHDWEKDVADIVQAIADRLSLALESATLLEATQKRSEIERLTAGITGKIGSTTQIDSILRTAAEELSRALGGSDVLVQIQSDATEENTEIMTGMA